MASKMRRSILLGCCAFMGFGMLAGCGKQDFSAVTTEGENKATEQQEVTVTPTPDIDGYQLLWSDEFDGSVLNTDNWDYDPHEPGWTNAELQEYTTSTDNVFVRDGDRKSVV